MEKDTITTKHPSKYIVVDIDGFEYLPTKSDTEEEAKEKMVRLDPDKPWSYYEEKGHRVKNLTIQSE